MHVLFLTWKDIKHPRKGGAEVVMYEYAKRLVSDGHRVTWFASNFKEGKSEESIDGIQIIRKYSINTIYFFAWKWYREFIQTNEVNIIIDEAGGIPLLSPLYEKHISIYFFIHHIPEKEFDNYISFPINKLLKKFAYRTFSLYKNFPTITVSNSTKKELQEKFGFTNIQVVENATHLQAIEKIDFEQKQNELVFLGRLTPMKRVDEAIRIFEIFLEKYPDYTLNLIGNKQDKEYSEQLELLVQEKKLQDKVFFREYSQENVTTYLSRAQAMLVTSEKEGFGLIVLEGNSFGLPVVSYDVAGLRDSVKEGKNGFLVADLDKKAFAEKLGHIIENTEEYQKIAKSSLGYLKNYGSWDDKYEELKQVIFK